MKAPQAMKSGDQWLIDGLERGEAGAVEALVDRFRGWIHRRALSSAHPSLPRPRHPRREIHERFPNRSSWLLRLTGVRDDHTSCGRRTADVNLEEEMR